MNLTDIRRPSDEFSNIAERIEHGIVTGLIKAGYTGATLEYEDTIRSVSFDALEELLDRIYEIENR